MRKALDLARRRAAAELRPVHVENEAPFFGVGFLGHPVDQALVFELLVLKAVVVVVQLHAGVVQLVGRRGEVGQKRAHALERAGVFLRHHADADVLAAHDAVVFDDLLGVFEDELRVCMRDNDLEVVFVADRADDARVDVAERGDLQCLEADVMQLFRRHAEVGLVLCKIADRKALCADNHRKRPFCGVRRLYKIQIKRRSRRRSRRQPGS